MNRKKFGDFVRKQREKTGLSRRLYSMHLSRFPDRLEVSEPYLVNVELATSSPPTGKLFDWAAAMEIDPRLLFEALEEPFPLQEKPEKFIPLPYDFPAEDQKQVELYVKFLQYQPEFEKFLELTGAGVVTQDDATVRDKLDAFVREVQLNLQPAQPPDVEKNGDRDRAKNRVS